MNRNRTRSLTIALLAATALLAFGASGASAATESVRNSASISLPGLGTASPYPSTINMPAMEGVITNVTVTFHDFSHNSGHSVFALLVSPDGKKSILMTGSCGYTSQPPTLLIFSDTAPGGSMPTTGPCDKIVYKPTENFPDEYVNFGSGVPAGPNTANLNNFLGSSAGGAWKLYIKGYGGSSSGKIAGGWSLAVQTANPDATVPGAGQPSGRASSYPLMRAVSGLGDQVITDLNVKVTGVFHQNAADLEMMLVGPRGQSAILMSDVCTGDVRYEYFYFDDEASLFMSPERACGSGTYRPVGRTDELFPPGPAPGTQTALSNFDLTDPNGQWSLYVFDDHPEDDKAGLFLDRFNVQVETRPKAEVDFPGSQLEVDEGGSVEAAVRRSAPAGAQLGAARVTVVPSAGSAGADDFENGARSVEFAPGETEKKVTFKTLADEVSEPDEGFELKLGNPTGDARLAAKTAATVTIREPAAGGAGAPSGDAGAPAPDRVAPLIGGLALSPRRFAVSRKRTAAVARLRRGTKIRYTLSEPATVRMRFQRAVRRRGSRRVRWVRAGTLRRAGRAGANRVAFSGRIGRRALKRGSYRLIVSATDAAGNRSTARPRALRILR